MARSKQAQLGLPAALGHVMQCNETDLVELNASRSDIPLCVIWVVRLVAVFLARGYQVIYS